MHPHGSSRANNGDPTNNGPWINFLLSSDATNFFNKHRLSIRVGTKRAKTYMQRVHISDWGSILHATVRGWGRWRSETCSNGFFFFLVQSVLLLLTRVLGSPAKVYFGSSEQQCGMNSEGKFGPSIVYFSSSSFGEKKVHQSKLFFSVSLSRMQFSNRSLPPLPLLPPWFPRKGSPCTPSCLVSCFQSLDYLRGVGFLWSIN